MINLLKKSFFLNIPKYKFFLLQLKKYNNIILKIKIQMQLNKKNLKMVQYQIFKNLKIKPLKTSMILNKNLVKQKQQQYLKIKQKQFLHLKLINNSIRFFSVFINKPLIKNKKIKKSFYKKFLKKKIIKKKLSKKFLYKKYLQNSVLFLKNPNKNLNFLVNIQKKKINNLFNQLINKNKIYTNTKILKVIKKKLKKKTLKFRIKKKKKKIKLKKKLINL
jgi:hypothetical protein